MKTKINNRTWKSVSTVVTLLALSIFTATAAPPKRQSSSQQSQSSQAQPQVVPAQSAPAQFVQTPITTAVISSGNAEVNASGNKPAAAPVVAPAVAIGNPPAPELITAATYAFTSAAGVVLENMSAGTTQLVGPDVDDSASALANIGFDFWYDGVHATQFSVNANGLARLGPTVIDSAFSNGLANVTDAPKIAP